MDFTNLLNPLNPLSPISPLNPNNPNGVYADNYHGHGGSVPAWFFFTCAGIIVGTLTACLIAIWRTR